MGESATRFKRDFLRYLRAYPRELVDGEMREYIELVAAADFSSVNVAFVGTIPGRHDDRLWGGRKLRKLLRKHATPAAAAAAVRLALTTSSFGQLGNEPGDWLKNEFKHYFRLDADNDTIEIVFPTMLQWQTFFKERYLSTLPDQRRSAWIQGYMR